MTGQDAEPTSVGELLGLDLQLCFAIYRASNRVTRLYRPILEPLGLTYPQYIVLLALWEAEPLTVGALGRRLSLDSGTLTPLLKRMEAQGLVRRARDAADERRVQVALTDAARALKARAAEVPARLLERVAMPLGDLVVLKGLLEKLNASLPAREGAAAGDPAEG